MALAALPAVIPLVLIFAYGVNTPVLDQWDAAGSLFVKAHLGQSSTSPPSIMNIGSSFLASRFLSWAR
jgi:hypothetical protein